MQDFPPRIATFFTGTSDAPTPDPDTRIARGVPAVDAAPAVAGHRAVDAGLPAVADAADLRPLHLRPGRRRRHPRRLDGRPADLGGRDARRGPGRRRLRRRLPHAGRAELADQPLRHHPDGHPQDRPDGPRAAAPLADRRGAQRRVERLRRVRRADRDPGALGRPARLLPDRRRHRAVDVVAARRARAGRRPGAPRRRPAAAAAAAPPPAGRAQPQLRADLDGHRHRRRAAHPARHRRRGDLRPQLRRPVAAARRAGVSSGIWQAAVEAVGRAPLRHLPGQPRLARHPRRSRRASSPSASWSASSATASSWSDRCAPSSSSPRSRPGRS